MERHKPHNDRRIKPAKLDRLPSVLDTQQVSDTLRISVERVRELTRLGLLHRLRYSRDYRYAKCEVRRFLRWSTETSEADFAAALEAARRETAQPGDRVDPS